MHESKWCGTDYSVSVTIYGQPALAALPASYVESAHGSTGRQLCACSSRRLQKLHKPALPTDRSLAFYKGQLAGRTKQCQE
eukprot:50590-Amphidinium_carterae.1